jgi:hypothetical protein
MATGTATLNFGALATNPSSNEASVVVTGQTSIVATSLVEAWIRLEATTEHSIEELIHDPIRIIAGNITAGTGFTIYGVMPYGRAYGTYKIDWVWV